MTKSVEEMPKTLNVETFKVDNDPILYMQRRAAYVRDHSSITSACFWLF